MYCVMRGRRKERERKGTQIMSCGPIWRVERGGAEEEQAEVGVLIATLDHSEVWACVIAWAHVWVHGLDGTIICSDVQIS